MLSVLSPCAATVNVSVSWEQNPTGPQPIGYYVNYSDNISSIGNLPGINVQYPNNSILIEGLDKNKLYYFTVSSYIDPLWVSEPSEVKVINTSLQPGDVNIEIKWLPNSDFKKIYFNGRATYTYTLQRSIDLEHWEDFVATNLTTSKRVETIVPSNQGQSFYRIKVDED